MTDVLNFSYQQKADQELIDPKGVLGLPKRQKTREQMARKMLMGFKAKAFSHVYFFSSRDVLESSLYFSLFFTSGHQTGKNQFLFSATSPKKTLEWAKCLKKMQGQTALIASDEHGRVSLQHLKEKLSPKSLLMAHRLFHPILGGLDDQYLEIAHILSEEGVLYYVDVTGALGERFFDLESIEADFISFDLASIDPVLSGVILLSKHAISDWVISPLDLPIDFYEKVLEGFEQFYDRATTELLERIQNKMSLEKALKETIPETHFIIGAPYQSVRELGVYFPEVHAEAFAFALIRHKMAVELGGGAEQTLSGLLELLQVEPSKALSAVMLHLPYPLGEEHRQRSLLILKEVYSSLRKGAI